MNNFLKTSALVLALGFSANMYAQETKVIAPKASSGGENIVIRKKSNNTEKLTIVVDGDKITINGKPVDEYKSDNVEITKGDSWSNNVYSYSTPSIAQSGDWNMFRDNFGKTIKSNKAILGVMTEKTDEGAKITDVTDDGAAAKAGLKEGDIITKLGDDKIADADDLYKAVGKFKADDKVTIAYKRDGKESTATATLQKNKEIKIYGLNSANNFNLKVSPDMRGFGYFKGKPRMGIQVQDTEDGKGVKLLDVDDESPADKAGLKEDDIITSVNGKNITSVDDLKEAVKDGKEGDTFKVTYTRGAETKTIDVHFPKELKTTNL